MPTVVLSPIGGSGEQFFNNNGTVLSGGKIYTYAAGTTTPLTTYTSLAGTVANANPVVLNSAGRVSGQIWLIYGASYKFVIKDSLGNTIDTQDNISGSSAAGGLVTAATIAALKAMTGMTTGTRVLVQDTGFYRYDSSSSTTAVGSLIVAPTSGGGRWFLEVDGENWRPYFDVTQYGADGTGATDSASAIIACNTAAAAVNGVVFFPAGLTFRVDSTVTLTTHVQGQGATISTSVDTTAVQIGDGTNYLADKVMYLPAITNAAKVTTGWTGSSVGLKTINTSACEIHLGHITNFVTGFWVTSSTGKGNVYNNYFLGHLDNNKVNLKLLPGATSAWVDENQFFGGRFSFNSSEGTAVSDTRHILVDFVNDAAGNVCNNNVFQKPSIEGDVPEFHVEINSGQYIALNFARWEATTPKLKILGYSAGKPATRNIVFFGYGAQNIALTEGSNCTNNQIQSSTNTFFQGGSGVNGSFVMVNTSSSAYPILVGLDASGTYATDPSTAYCYQIGSQSIKGKRTADVNERMKLDLVNGRVYLGNASGAVSAYLAPNGVDHFTMGVGQILPKVRTITAATDSPTAAADEVLFCNRAGVIGVTLPAHVAGLRFTFIDLSGAANVNNITITPASGTISGAGTYVINTAYGRVRLISTGATWLIESST